VPGFIITGAPVIGNGGIWESLGALGQKDADGLVKDSFDAGVTFFDTADVYAGGMSETIFGQSLRNLGQPRDEVVVATKVFGRVTPPAPQKLSPLTPMEETLSVLDDVVKAGKARYIGLCNQPAWGITKSLWISDKRNLHHAG
jgi:aryl-alcohol dehydrogenase-like predicted oxidoreductase